MFQITDKILLSNEDYLCNYRKQFISGNKVLFFFFFQLAWFGEKVIIPKMNSDFSLINHIF